MSDALEQIDTSAIEELVLIKKDREVLDERLERLLEQESSVSPTVFERVKADYETRREQLAEKAAPLKQSARVEFARLETLKEEAQAAVTATGLDREELELRHEVGEFDEQAYSDRRQTIDDKLAEQEAALAGISEVRDRFVAAFDSEEELLAPSLPEPLPVSETAPVAIPLDDDDQGNLPLVPLPEVEGEVLVVESAEEAVLPQLEPLPDEEGSATDSAAAEGSEEPAPVEGPADGTVLLTDAPIPEGPDEIGGTTMLRNARLVPVEPIAAGSEFTIEPVTTVGRTKQNQIRIDEPAVSRRHAQLTLSEDGYLIRDLGSENGTLVNGERIEEHRLAEGDRVQIGTVQFIFHGPEPTD